MGKVVALQMTDKWVFSGMLVSVTGRRWGWTSLGSPENEPHRLAKPTGEKRAENWRRGTRSCAEVGNKKSAVMPLLVPNGENLMVFGYHIAAS